VTRRLLSTVLDEGPGHKYLIQHSADSGKTMSIAWTAHFFSDLHTFVSEPQGASPGGWVVTNRRLAPCRSRRRRFSIQ